MSTANSYEIAIVGMSGRFPGAQGLDDLWRKIRDSENGISVLTEEQLLKQGIPESVFNHPSYVKAAPVLDNVEGFEPSFFGLTPREAELMDPQQRIFLECCWEALEHAGCDSGKYPYPVGVFAGARTNTYLVSLLTHPSMIEAVGMFHLGLGNDLAFLTTRVSHVLNLRGPSCSLHTACSTSLVAVHMACQSLLIDECRMALAGGIAVNVPHVAGYMYEEGSVQSPDGSCRVFDADARGTVFGSGAGVVALKRLEDALNDGDTIHAVIRGSAINNDGAAKASFTAPSVQGQIQVIKEALLNAGLSPQDIGYIECHGTGTLLGDAIEVRALSKAFGEGKANSCALGSVKSNVGHLDAAAGVIGLIKTVLALKHRMIPPSLHYRRPNPQINFAGTPFYVNTVLSPWKQESGPLRAGVSAFGVGGTNAHVVLEEAPEAEAGGGSRPWHLLVLSARSEEALEEMGKNLAGHLRQHEEQDMADVAYTLQTGRQRFSWRRTLVCGSREEAMAMLEQGSEGMAWEHGEGEEGGGRTVFLFPGQGAQHRVMGGELYEREPVYRKHMEECSEVLKDVLGVDLGELLSGGGGEKEERLRGEMDQTWLAQPALLAVEYALAQLWMSWGIRPEAMLGHSLGEYTAACVAGVMTVEEGLKLVAERGRLMQRGRPGAMLAVMLGAEEVGEMLGKGLSVAAVNAPGLCTVSGEVEPVEELKQRLQEGGVNCQRLRTSHAFHSEMVEDAGREFLEQVRKLRLRAPCIPFISNVTGKWIREEEARDAEYWVRQMREPVQFAGGMEELLREEGRVMLEVGPGQGLRRLGLRQREARRARLLLASLPGSGGGSEQQAMLNTLGRMWAAGAEVDWKGFQTGKRRRVPLPTYPFQRRRFWIDPAPRDSSLSTNAPTKIPKSPNVAEWFWTPSWKLANTLAGSPSFQSSGLWMVFSNGADTGTELIARLKQEKQEVVTVMKGTVFARLREDLYTIAEKADYQRLFASLVDINQRPINIVHLWSLADAPAHVGNKAELFQHYQEDGLYALLDLLQTMAVDKSGVSRRVWVVTNNSVMVENSDSIIPEKSGLLMLCKIAPQEMDWLSCSVIDMAGAYDDSANMIAGRILRELAAGQMHSIVAYRGRNRWLQCFERSQLSAGNPVRKLPFGGVFLVTGGLGAVPLLIEKHLASTVKAKFVLLGRTLLPARDLWPDIAGQNGHPHEKQARSLLDLEAKGSEIEIVQGDVTNVEDMRFAVDLCYQRFGRLDGVIHAAGVTIGPTVFCAIADLHRDAFAVQARPKVQGLQILEEVLREKDVPFVMALSSNASVLGGLGFSAYAAANSFMDSFVAEISTRSTRTAWISSNWDHWPQETKRMTQYRTTLDDYAMTDREALDAVDRVLANFEAGQIIIATGNLEQRAQLWVQRDFSSPHGKTTAIQNAHKEPRPVLKSVYVPPRNEIESQLVKIWEEFLGIQKIGTHDDFFELGGHSLLATKLVSEIRAVMNVELPLAKLFEGPTISKIAEALDPSTGFPKQTVLQA